MLLTLCTECTLHSGLDESGVQLSVQIIHVYHVIILCRIHAIHGSLIPVIDNRPIPVSIPNTGTRNWFHSGDGCRVRECQRCQRNRGRPDPAED